MPFLLYDTALFFLRIYLTFSSLYRKKSKEWLQGQKELLPTIQREQKDGLATTIWIHVASLGEYEQVKPILSSFKEGLKHSVVLTVFSPSAYAIIKKECMADHIYYLPFDRKKNVEGFLSAIQPQLVLFVKYEFWFNYCLEIKERKIPFLSISTRLHEKHFFTKWYAKPYRKVLSAFTHFFTQDQESKEILSRLGFFNTTFSGDTRYDRVADIVDSKKKVTIVEQFKKDAKLLVVGSSWHQDIGVLLPYLKTLANNRKVIIAPHKVDAESIRQLQAQLTDVSYECYSTYQAKNTSVLIVDTIGLLSSIYQYADIAYVGGAFKTGLHNILEPTAYGVPVVFGPHYQKYSEAKVHIHQGIAFSIHDSLEYMRLMTRFEENEGLLLDIKQKADYLMKQNRGATRLILNYLERLEIID